MKIKILFAAILIFTGSGNLFAQVDLDKTGQSTMNFLLVGTSSRAAALGEAYTALGSSSEAMFYNPAGIANLDNTFDVNLNYTQWIADINYLSGAAAWNTGEYGVIGLSLLTVDYGTINGTSLVPDGMQSAYPLGYIDNGPVSNVGAFSIGLTYAKAISREFSIGGSVKLAGQNLGSIQFADGTSKDNDATKLVFDAGIRYITGFKSFTFGMYIRNFASNIKRELVDEQLPLTFSLGVAMNLMEVINSEAASDNMINFAADFLHQNNYSERVNIGLEYRFQNMISLRGGYQTNRDLASWSGGVGFNTTLADYDVEINYSYSKFEIFDNVNRISLNFAF